MTRSDGLQWYRLEGDSAAREMVATVKRIWERTGARRAWDRYWLRMVSDETYCGFAGDASSGMRERVQAGENVVGQVVGTLSARLAKSRTQPVILADLADWESQRRCRRLQRLVWGALQSAGAHAEQRLSDLHGLILGTGVLHVCTDDSKIQVEHCPTWELHVDPSDGRYGHPRALYRVRALPRALLYARFPEAEADISACHQAPLEDLLGSGSDSYDCDMVTVYEAWHLPSGGDAGDGRHLISLESGLLLEEAWERPRFPFAFWRFSLRPKGFWGQGIVEPLVPMQLEMSRSYAAMQEGLRRQADPYWAVERSSQVRVTDLGSGIGRVLQYTGAMPQVVQPNALSPALLSHSEQLRGSIFSQSGVSSMAAQSMKPAGLDSGRAIMAYNDITSERFADAEIRREEQMRDVGELILDELEAGASGDVVCESALGIERISWADVRADRDSYRMQVSPASSLPRTLAGKQQALMGLIDLGINLSPNQIASALDLPDLETLRDQSNSQEDLLSQTIEVRILDEGQPVAPEPTWDLTLAMKLAAIALDRATLANAPEDRRDLLRRFIVECQALLQAAQQSTGAPMPPAGAPPDMGAAPPGELAAPME